MIRDICSEGKQAGLSCGIELNSFMEVCVCQHHHGPYYVQSSNWLNFLRARLFSTYRHFKGKFWVNSNVEFSFSYSINSVKSECQSVLRRHLKFSTETLSKFLHRLLVWKEQIFCGENISLNSGTLALSYPSFHAQKLKNLLQSHRLRRLTLTQKGYVIFEFVSVSQPHEK